jgi:predicted Holliday junction resolvase-like endonuclease
MSITLNDQQVAVIKNYLNNMPTLYGRHLLNFVEQIELQQAQEKAQAEVSAKIAQARKEAEIKAKAELEEKVEDFKKEKLVKTKSKKHA